MQARSQNLPLGGKRRHFLAAQCAHQ